MNIKTLKSVELALKFIFGITFLAILYLYVLNNRYTVIANVHVIDKWTGVRYSTTPIYDNTESAGNHKWEKVSEKP